MYFKISMEIRALTTRMTMLSLNITSRTKRAKGTTLRVQMAPKMKRSLSTKIMLRTTAATRTIKKIASTATTRKRATRKKMMLRMMMRSPRTKMMLWETRRAKRRPRTNEREFDHISL